MAVIALDISKTRTGWALHGPGMERPHFGCVSLASPTEDLGRPLEAIRALLAEQHDAFTLTDIVFEKQHIGMVSSKKFDPATKKFVTEQRMMNPQTFKVLLALAGMVEWFAYRVNAQCYDVPIQSHRKHFIGRGDYGKDEAKRRASDTCRQLGWHVPNHDAAEACSILDYYLSLVPGYVRPWRDSLLMAGTRV